jgi:hypothetical protein
VFNQLEDVDEMPDMPTNSSRIRVLVLGDHEILCEAIKMGLRRRFEVEFVEPPSYGVAQRANDPFGKPDLVIVIVLSTQSVLMELLTQASPYGMPGEIPLLAIAEEGQKPDLDAEGVYRLDFPFTYEELYDKTAEILTDALAYAGRGEVAW